MPARRFSDGRLIIDFIELSCLLFDFCCVSRALGLPFINAYLDSVGTNFYHGINFATVASTIRLPNRIMPNDGGFSPFYLDLQYSQFEQFKSRSHMTRELGGLLASLMPKGEYFPKALYTSDIGQNDLAEGFFENLTIQQINASVPDIVNKFLANVKKIYRLGARSFWIHNTGPIGCLPYVLTAFSSAEKGSAGFELPLVTCCGYGGQYNFNAGVLCGGTITVHGANIFVGSCDRPSVRVVWDGVHYTEAAIKYIFDQISTRSFSDPRVPLEQARQKSSN
ncbi:hypothetical protein PTKIN_Ptkin09bG0282200 [Pterospermum kingtungense]